MQGVETFVDKWRGREGGAERANYALFLSELTEALDLPRPEPADSRSGYRFEFPVRGDAGQPYRIDLYKRDCFILEAKQSRWAGEKNELVGQAELFTAERELKAERTRRYDPLMRNAFNQAWGYVGRLPAEHDSPPFIIACDVGRSLELYSDFSGQGRNYRAFPTERERVIPIEGLLDPAAQDLLRQVWTAPRTLDPALKRAEVTRGIAEHVAQVSQSLEQAHSAEEVASFLSRWLFALFAQSPGVGLLPDGSVTRLLSECLDSPDSFMMSASDLFRAMDAGGDCVALRTTVRKFNGAFFKDHRAFPLAREQIGALIQAAKADWANVEPAIFGTLLEKALTPSERTVLGAHYTPRPYVERLVVATVMDPLRAEWDAARAAAEAARAGGDLDGARLEIAAFHERLTQVRVLDPACGTGNFLYVALELMKGLESEVLEALEGLGGQAGLGGLAPVAAVGPRQFFGLELNPRAAAIAELVLWIGYLQASFRRGGYAVKTPVLESLGNIRRMDAVLAHDAPDWLGSGGDAYPNPRRPEWPAAEFIVGNPPFLGGKDIRGEFGSAYAKALWAAHPRMNDSADFVMYWWDHAADLLTRKGTALRRFGLVTTNSITQTFSRRTVERWMANKSPLSLVYAVQDHPWRAAVKDAAMVRISMTVAQAGTHDGALHEVTREEETGGDAPVVETRVSLGRINADLTVGVDVTKARPLLANEGLCSPGVKLHGAGFIVTRLQAERLGLATAAEAAALAVGAEPPPRAQGHGVLRPGLEAHIRPYLNGRDLTQASRGKLVIDLFGLTSEGVRTAFPEVYERVSNEVRYAYGPDGQPRTDDKGRRIGREYNNRPTYKDNWWVFGEPRSELRPALAGAPLFIATVETSKHRTFSFVDGGVTPDNMLVVVASPDAAHLAVLSSLQHVTWATRAGGWLGFGNDPRYSKSRTFDPFPFPPWTEAQRAALAVKGEALDAFRKARMAEHGGLTLTRLYNALEKHRLREGARVTGRPVPEWEGREAQDAADGAVLALAELHDEIDRLTLVAYRWSDLGAAPPPAPPPGPSAEGVEQPPDPRRTWEEQVLSRLVALNAQRRSEEAAGEVRWLRPAYQIPRFGETAAAGQAVGDLIGATPAPDVDKANWPRDGRSRVLAIKGVLAEVAAPTSAPAVAARFKGRTARRDVESLLQALQRDGQVRATPAGYLLARAA